MKKRTWLFTAVAMLAVLALVAVAGCGATTTTTTKAPATTATTAGPATTATTAGPATTATTAAAKITLKYAFFTPATTFPGVQMDWWAAEINKRTNGQVTVQTFPGGTLLTAKNMYDGVLSGVADIGLSFVTYEPGRFPLLSINDLPGLGYTSALQASKSFFDVVWANQNIAELKDFKVITAFSTEPAFIQSLKEYTTLASLKGAEIRTPGGPKILEALGAVGVGMPQSEVAQALQTGVIKGIMTSREVLKDFKYAEKCKFILNKPLGQVSALAVMRKDKYDALPDNVKKMIDQLAPEAATKAGEVLDAAVKASVDWAVSTQGVKVIDISAEEAKKFDDALAPLTATWLKGVADKGLPADDFYKQLQTASAKYAK
jgi:TRAP-type C4-dicarboxylate transport system substrate-binding protein